MHKLFLFDLVDCFLYPFSPICPNQFSLQKVFLVSFAHMISEWQIAMSKNKHCVCDETPERGTLVWFWTNEVWRRARRRPMCESLIPGLSARTQRTHVCLSVGVNAQNHHSGGRDKLQFAQKDERTNEGFGPGAEIQIENDPLALVICLDLRVDGTGDKR